VNTSDYLTLGGMVISAVAILGGWIQVLHTNRTKAFEAWRAASEKSANEWRGAADRRMDRIDLDIRSVQTQMQAFSTEIAKGYVQRSEFLHAIDQIATRIQETVSAANERVDRLIERIGGPR